MIAGTAIHLAPAPEGGVAGRRIVSATRPLLGGTVGVHVQADSDGLRAALDASRLLGRIEAWADRLTRFTTTSDLARLNADRRSAVPVGPTLAATLDWGREAEGRTDGMVDIALLDERLTAEAVGRKDGSGSRSGADGRRASVASRRWSLDRRRRGAIVHRPAGLRFDLDGVAKGWLADRALDLLEAHPSALVDADGDIAIRIGPADRWEVGIADPHLAGHDLAVLRLSGTGLAPTRLGLATSGTSVHRWVDANGDISHHLIDPRSALPASTDVVQATVLASTAREAEAWAKTAVILGVEAAIEALDRPGIEGAILLTDRSETVTLPATQRWLA